jgi:zinc/manganese transport system substrate-binding protein
LSARRRRGGTVRHRLLRALASLATCAALAAAPRAGAAPARRTIVATTSILGSVVRDLVGEDFEVKVAIPNGLDPHEWEPSARDIETLTHADLIVANGLGLEGGIQRTLDQARRGGVKLFTASDHITVRKVGPGEGIPSGDPDQVAGAQDPHIWTDPLTMKAVARALATELRTDFGVDLSARLADLDDRLDRLDAEIRSSLAAIPPANRKLVTGHESMGYFAQRYGFELVGAVVPSLSSQAESSAAGLEALKALIARNGVRVLFTELGTPPRVTEVLAREAGVRCVTLITHSLPADGSYFSFMRRLAGTIVSNLR